MHGAREQVRRGLMTSWAAAACCVAMLAGCGGSDGAPGANALDTLTVLGAEPAGDHCANGGTRITSGLDANGNGVLDAAEITSTQFVCNGASGGDGRTTLVVSSPEPAGAHCASGGTRISSGLDANGDGILEDSEVTSSAYACSGAAGTPGATGAPGAAGIQALLAFNSLAVGDAHCPNGGLEVDAGGDLDGNGVLGSTEITSRAYVCNGSGGASGTSGLDSLIAQSPEPAGGPCANGGTRITSGLDTNRDGILEANEVTATSDVCNPPATSPYMTWVDLTATTAQAAPNSGYLADSASPVTITLPPDASLAIGDRVAVTGRGTGGWTIAQNAGQTIYGKNIGLAGGVLWTAQESARSWQGVASSADGQRLVAVVRGGAIYTSTDAGVSWTPRDAARNWWGVASSADGSRLVAVENGGQVYTSADAGLTWTPRDSVRNWYAVASSSDGTMLVAVAFNGQIYTSSDAGVTWVPRDSSRSWDAVASSADGTKLVATEDFGHIYVSTDSGVTWTPHESFRQWDAVASSSDGMSLVAAELSGHLYTSTDGGLSWTPRDDNRAWSSVASSADGVRLVAGALNGMIYTSTDSGVTWTARDATRPWAGVASSASGDDLVAVTDGGQVYTSRPFTTLGTTGAVSGGQFDAIDLQYLGGGVFVPIAGEGAFGFR